MRKLIAMTGCVLMFIACSSRKKTLQTSDVVLIDSASYSLQQSSTALQTDYFSDYLSGSFALSELDTVDRIMESRGLTVKLKRMVDKSGKVSLGFQAEAKPVARTKLQHVQSQARNENKQRIAQSIRNEKVEPAKSKWSGFFTWLIVVAIGMITAFLLIKRIDRAL